MYLADHFGFTVIDGEDNRIVTRFEFTDEMGTGYLTKLDAVKGKVYAITTDEIMIFSKDPEDETSYTDQRIVIGNVTAYAKDIAFNPNTELIYASYDNDDLLYIIDPVRFDEIPTINLGHDGESLIIDEDNNKIYVAGENSVTIIDGVTNKPLPSFIELDEAGATDITIDSRKDLLYVAHSAFRAPVISVIDISTNKLIETFRLGDWDFPALLAEANPQNSLLYALSTRGPGSLGDDLDSLYIIKVDPHSKLVPSKQTVTVGAQDIVLDFQSSSTIEGLVFEEATKRITLKLSGHDGEEGTTILTIGRVLKGPYTVTIAGNTVTDYEIMEDADAEATMKMTYTHGTEAHEAIIIGTEVVPEFPVSVLIMTGAIASIILVLRMRKGVGLVTGSR